MNVKFNSIQWEINKTQNTERGVVLEQGLKSWLSSLSAVICALLHREGLEKERKTKITFQSLNAIFYILQSIIAQVIYYSE